LKVQNEESGASDMHGKAVRLAESEVEAERLNEEKDLRYRGKEGRQNCGLLISARLSQCHEYSFYEAITRRRSDRPRNLEPGPG
jgi:hypothetical protein